MDSIIQFGVKFCNTMVNFLTVGGGFWATGVLEWKVISHLIFQILKETPSSTYRWSVMIGTTESKDSSNYGNLYFMD